MAEITITETDQRRTGNRSAAVAEALNGAGYKADTMAGGMTAWTRAGLPTT
jgi:rhodanese-related sulfurtransferase